MDDQLLADREIARALSISPVTIRKQRFDRRHGLPHWFTVDPVMIGSVPRYRQVEIKAWLASLVPFLATSAEVLAFNRLFKAAVEPRSSCAASRVVTG